MMSRFVWIFVLIFHWNPAREQRWLYRSREGDSPIWEAVIIVAFRALWGTLRKYYIRPREARSPACTVTLWLCARFSNACSWRARKSRRNIVKIAIITDLLATVCFAASARPRAIKVRVCRPARHRFRGCLSQNWRATLSRTRTHTYTWEDTHAHTHTWCESRSSLTPETTINARARNESRLYLRIFLENS